MKDPEPLTRAEADAGADPDGTGSYPDSLRGSAAPIIQLRKFYILFSF